MFNKQCIKTPSKELLLDSVKYKKVAAKGRKEIVNVRSIVDDSYEVLNIYDRDIEVQFTRKVSFQPKAVMNATVVISVIFALNRNNRKEVTDEIIQAELSERAEELFVSAASNASLIISSLSSVSFMYPLITPPFYTTDNL